MGALTRDPEDSSTLITEAGKPPGLQESCPLANHVCPTESQLGPSQRPASPPPSLLLPEPVTPTFATGLLPHQARPPTWPAFRHKDTQTRDTFFILLGGRKGEAVACILWALVAAGGTLSC